MPLTNWGAFNPNTYQAGRSTGRGWGNQVYRGGPNYRQQSYQPPMPYTGAGASYPGYSQPASSWGYRPQRPQPRRGGGGMGGTVGVGRGQIHGDPYAWGVGGRPTTQSYLNIGLPESLASMLGGQSQYGVGKMMEQLGFAPELAWSGVGPQKLALMMNPAMAQFMNPAYQTEHAKHYMNTGGGIW